MKINLGAGPNWYKDGWFVLDHKIKKRGKFKIPGDLNKIKIRKEVCDLVFISHTLEHIPHIQIQNVLIEINRIMKKNSTIRILVPNLEVIAKAYVKKDWKFFKKAKEEDHSIRTDLGLGGMFVNFIVSTGQDTALLNRNLNKFISGYAHLYAYDFEMMKILLKKTGFKSIKKMHFCKSEIKDFTEPCHILGLSKKYSNLNNKFYKKNNLIHEYKKGKYNINFKFSGFDKDPLTSLIIEAKKNKYIKLKVSNDINLNSKNYNRYGFSLLHNKAFQKKIRKLK